MREGVAKRNKRYIIEQLKKGKRLIELAQEFGVHSSTLCRPLQRFPDYLNARISCDRLRLANTALRKDADARKAYKRHLWRYLWDFGPDEWLVEHGLIAPGARKLSTMAQRNRARLRGERTSK